MIKDFIRINGYIFERKIQFYGSQYRMVGIVGNNVIFEDSEFYLRHQIFVHIPEQSFLFKPVFVIISYVSDHERKFRVRYVLF